MRSTSAIKMSSGRSSRRTNREEGVFFGDAFALILFVTAGLAAALYSTGCSPAGNSREAEFLKRAGHKDGEVRILVCHIGFPPASTLDKDPEQSTADDRPLREAIEVIQSVRPDIVAVLHIENRARWETLLQRLGSREDRYPHTDFQVAEDASGAMGIVSRFPIIERRVRLDLDYSIQGHPRRMSREMVDVTVLTGPQDPLRLLLAHLKNKTFHQLGQTEMRRNEARLVARHIHSILDAAPECRLLLAGALHDESESAAVQKIIGQPGTRLVDLRPADPAGNAWTERDRSGDIYTRSDYLLASPAVAARVATCDTRILDIPVSKSMSMHRPILVGIRADGE